MKLSEETTVETTIIIDRFDVDLLFMHLVLTVFSLDPYPLD